MLKASILQKNLFVKSILSEKNNNQFNLVYLFKIENTAFENFTIDKFSAVCQQVFGSFLFLSSYFVNHGEEIFQHFEENYASKIKEQILIKDISNLDAIQQQLFLSNWQNALYHKYFNLSIFPLWHIEIVKVDQNIHYIAFVFHHIIVDTIFLQKIFTNFAKAYNYDHNTQLSFSEQKLLYQKYLDKEADYNKHQLTLALRFYQNYLPTQSFKCQLPWKNSDGSNEANRIYQQLDINFITLVNNTASNFNTTKFCLLLAIFSCFLAKFTDNKKVIFGYPIGKRFENLKQADWFQVNTLPINEEVDWDQSFAHHHNIISKIHQFNIKNRLLDISCLKQNLSNQTTDNFYNVIFSSTHFGEMDFVNLNSTRINPHSLTAIQDLILYLDTTNNKEWQIAIEYKTTLFSANIAQSILTSFVYFVNEVCQNPFKSIKEYKLCHDTTILQPIMLPDVFVPIVKAIEANQSFLHNIAIIDKNKQISYAQLLNLVGKGAAYLANNGVVKGDKVIIFMPKTIVNIIAILSIIKIGAIYVPVDTSWPAERINSILEQVEPKIILTDRNQHLSKSFQSYVISIFEASEGDNFVFDFTKININKNDDVYIIFTSGSTGEPKGVVINHQGLSNLAFSQGKILDITSHSKVFLFASLCFDASISEIFTTLLYGGTLCLTDCKQSDLVAKLPDLIRAFNINTITLPPSILTLFEPYQVTSVEKIVLAGESFGPSIIAKWSEKFKLFNAYGPTENTVCVSMHQITPNSLANNVGKPLAGIGVFIQGHERIMPMGAAGEICITGANLSKGYLKNPSANSKHFATIKIDNQVTRYYKTGDIGYICDDEIIFLGRRDRQVKIKGFRIELDEIQNIIYKYPDVLSTYVCILQDQIIAFVTLQNFANNTDDISNFIANFLPYYMVPYKIIALEQMPLTLNGKVDEQLLLKNYLSIDGKIKQKNIKPRCDWDEVGTKIKHVWEQILKCQVNSIYDNFFDLGGESLKAVRLVVELKKIFGLSINVADFFDNPTIINCVNLVKGLLSLERNFKYINDILIDIPLLAKKPENSYLANRPKTILLTGSSGFIGGYILDAIVRNKNLYKVYCLIRDCSNTQEGLRKIKNNLMTYGICLLNEKVITPINYNLELPNLGLSASDLNKLQTEVTDIVHVAGWVHHVYDYLTLRDVNVKGTIELINICAAKQSKRFHYISALSAINDFESGYIQETWPMKEAPTLSGGYNQTKWSCEMLVKKLSISGYQTYLYRLPTIWGASDNAAFTWQKDHQALLIRGCLELGYVPQIESFLILAPVNKIASLISQNIFNNNAASNVLNMVLFKPYSWNSLYNLLAKKYNFNFKFISFADWQNKLINLDKANAMYALSSLYLSYKTYQFAIKINETSCANFTNTFGIMPQNLNEDYLTQNLEQFLP